MVGVCISLTFWGEMDIMRSSECPNGLGGQLETSVHNHIDVIRRTRGWAARARGKGNYENACDLSRYEIQ
jgi:hypothetical protein